MTFEEYLAAHYKYWPPQTFEQYKLKLADFVKKYKMSDEKLKLYFETDSERELERLKTSWQNEEKRMNPPPITVPPGEYWLGDPCYSFSTWGKKKSEIDLDALWRESNKHKDFYNPVRTCSLLTFYEFFTQHGDGSYRDNFGNTFCVDAGVIGLVPVGILPAPRADLAVKVKFTEPTLCRRERDGTLFFGLHIIQTGWDGESGDDYEEV